MEPILVKIGGELVDDSKMLHLLIDWLKEQYEKDQPVIIVHGAGKQVDTLSQRLKIKTQKYEGRRVTNRDTLEVFVQGMAGLVNKKLISEFRQSGLSPVGITAADANITTSIRRKPLSIKGKEIDFGFVGEIEKVDTKFIDVVLNNHFTPVIGCLTWSDNDGLLNINADTLAMKLAGALHCQSLILLTKTGAVLDHLQQSIPKLTWSDFQKGLEEDWIKEGMIPKLQTGFKALANGVKEVSICNPETLQNSGGTTLINDQNIKYA